MPRVTDDILPILTKFHREIVLPDIQRIVGESEQRLRNEIHNAFDTLAQLETEYQMLVAGLKRVEERLDRIEQGLDRVALKAEVQDLKARVEALERKIAEIDADL